MTKAQQIRAKKNEMIDNEVKFQAEKIFDWLLDIFEKNIEKGEYEGIELLLFKGKCKILTGYEGVKYDLSGIISKYDEVKIFKALSNLINCEEGYTAKLNLNNKIYDADVISLVVVIN